MGNRVKVVRASIWGAVCVLSLALYAANRFYFRQQEISYAFSFLRNHFNDVLAPVFLLSLVTCIGSMTGKHYRLSLSYVMFICCAGSLAWEYGAERFGMQATFDLKDILCYFCGGIGCYLLSRCMCIRRKEVRK